MIGHYTNEEIEKSDFVFISYKHTDAESVEAILSILYEKGVRFWYDVNLQGGDDWTEKAKSLIKNKNCKGVIFFNSPEAFKAEAVHNERLWTLERIAAEKSRGGSFYTFPANKDGDSNLLLLKKVFDTLDCDALKLSQQFPYERLSVITQLFNDRVIFVNSSNAEEAAEKLFSSINEKLQSVIDTDYLQMKKLETLVEEESLTLTFGICRDKPESNIPPYRLQANQAFTEHGEAYMVIDCKGYSTKPIIWRALYSENDIFVLISEYSVDTRCGGKDLNAWLEQSLLPLAFNEEERSAIRKIRLLSCEDIKAIEDQKKSSASIEELLSFPEDSESHWWIADMAMGALQKVIRKNGTVYKSGYNSRNSKSGVRPVIEIHADDLKKLKNN